MVEALEWGRMFKGDQYTWFFLFEVVFRTTVMFALMILFFRLSGKSEIKQLNIYDVIIIVGLGSAAGDPMLYDDVPLLNAVAIFITVLGLYRLMTYLAGKSKKIEGWLEGETRCLMEDTNYVNLQSLHKEKLEINDLFASLRMQKISQLGQVERIYIEISGEFSVFFRKDEDVQPGLPIYPEELAKATAHIDIAGDHSCKSCGYTQTFQHPTAKPVCPNCKKIYWVKASGRKRIT
ncbi:MAG: YetF domain-containing protein [Ginsengibacter sp.]